MGHLRTLMTFCSSLDFEWKIGYLHGNFDDLLYFALPISAALGFKFFFNTALRAKRLPTPAVNLTEQRAKL